MGPSLKRASPLVSVFSVPGKRGNRKLEVLGLDMSGYPTYQALAAVRDRLAFRFELQARREIETTRSRLTLSKL